ncbi:hypothetical protein SDC9_194194 [bioreactor metagenome]|uniref:Uncharacterized protein n=1 Tax=bioreactor metagenome TaxID=1076179 RepID=A0A645IGW9_9ZZZZ
MHAAFVLLDRPDTELVAHPALHGADAEGVPLVVGGVHALQKERGQAGQYRLAAFLLDHPHRIVVGVRLELHQDLADHAHPWLARNVEQRQFVELPDDLVDKPGETDAAP